MYKYVFMFILATIKNAVKFKLVVEFYDQIQDMILEIKGKSVKPSEVLRSW